MMFLINILIRVPMMKCKLFLFEKIITKVLRLIVLPKHIFINSKDHKIQTSKYFYIHFQMPMMSAQNHYYHQGKLSTEIRVLRDQGLEIGILGLHDGHPSIEMNGQNEPTLFTHFYRPH